jgi:hypothetical protein
MESFFSSLKIERIAGRFIGHAMRPELMCLDDIEIVCRPEAEDSYILGSHRCMENTMVEELWYPMVARLPAHGAVAVCRETKGSQKAGNPRLRRTRVELAWLSLRYHSHRQQLNDNVM